MSTPGAAKPTTPAARGWTELASRGTDGLEISLLWSRATGQVKVAVVDSRCDDEFELEVAGADALAAFHHPFAFAAVRGVCFGDALRERNDLQLQN